MIVKYRGFEIDVHRGKCNGGWSMLYYSAFRISDGWEFLTSFEDSDETVRDMIKMIKRRIDDYFENPKDYEDEVEDCGNKTEEEKKSD